MTLRKALKLQGHAHIKKALRQRIGHRVIVAVYIFDPVIGDGVFATCEIEYFKTYPK